MSMRERAPRRRPGPIRWLAVSVITAVVATACASDTGTTTRSERRSETRCDRPYSTGRHEDTLTSGGVVRQFLVFVPGTYDGAKPMPLVLDLHGSLLTAEAQLEMSGLERAAEAEGFLVVAPQAANDPPEWNIPGVPSFTGEQLRDAPDDIQFIAELLDTLTAQLCVDQRRIYATGYSGGGRLASRLACDLSDRIAAIAPVAGVRYPDDCTPDRPVPVIAFHGTADTQNPFDGGGPPYWSYGVAEAIDRWARHNRCTTTSTREAPAVTVEEWDDCAENSNVVLFTINGAGHEWPTGREADASVDASTELWEFFTAHALPARQN